SADGDVIDTTTAMGKLFFTIVGAFSEFERDMIVQRVNAGLDRARKAGVTLGRPRLGAEKNRDKAAARSKVADKVRSALSRGDKGILKIASELGVGSGTVQR